MARPAPWRAPWALRLLQLQMAVGYLLSAWAKLRGNTWHDGTALGLALRIEDLQRFAVPEWLFCQAILLNLLTWAHPRVRGPASCSWCGTGGCARGCSASGVAFHLGIDVFLDVGFFSIALWLVYLGFIFPDVADRIVGRFDPVGVAASGVRGRPQPRTCRRRLRWRSSQPSSTATARGSWRSRWPAPRMMRSSASPCASTSTRASNTGHEVVVAAVHHEQRSRGQLRRGRHRRAARAAHGPMRRRRLGTSAR